MKFAMMALLLAASSGASAHVSPQALALENFDKKPILADIADLQALNIPVMAQDGSIGVGYAEVTPFQQYQIQERSHSVGKCGGFEDLTGNAQFLAKGVEALFAPIREMNQKNLLYEKAPFRQLSMSQDPTIMQALSEVSEDNLRNYVTWLSSFENRYNKSPTPNLHVNEMKLRLEAMLSGSQIPYEVSLISHGNTKQESIRVRLIGKERPSEIIVLGGHLDSINQSGWGSVGKDAPGADDNASGSANLIEALRILIQKPQPQRTVEFMWYAGEESGLLGSAEIASQYKSSGKDVIAVLQLDMTLFPGSGEFVIGSMTDFTSAWLRDYLKAMNGAYLRANVVEDRCGYGCSDHASWYRNGYPTLMPFEARMKQSNKNIHTTRDVISPELNFRHSAMYTKIALVFAMDLANSQDRQP